MMNWVWVIPWAAIILFCAGLAIGSKVTRKRVSEMKMKAEMDRYRDEHVERDISDIYKSLARLEEKIERSFYTTKKEE